jgi:hypothetical protein
MAAVPTPEGAVLVNFGNDANLFDKYLRDLESQTGAAGRKEGFFQGMYEENPWDTDAGRYGQSYLRMIEDRPSYLREFDQFAPDIAAKLRDEYRLFAKDRGLSIPVSFDEVLASISGGGEKELRELIRKRGMAKGGHVTEDEIVTSLQDLLSKYDLA